MIFCCTIACTFVGDFHGLSWQTLRLMGSLWSLLSRWWQDRFSFAKGHSGCRIGNGLEKWRRRCGAQHEEAMWWHTAYRQAHRPGSFRLARWPHFPFHNQHSLGLREAAYCQYGHLRCADLLTLWLGLLGLPPHTHFRCVFSNCIHKIHFTSGLWKCFALNPCTFATWRLSVFCFILSHIFVRIFICVLIKDEVIYD